ncbi:hypothetical protein [Cryobacterium fucosi]|nr:hypothetical protein [Cryobacterium fucosi]
MEEEHGLRRSIASLLAVYALGDVGDNAKQAIDTITAGFYRCGDNPSNT